MSAGDRAVAFCSPVGGGSDYPDLHSPTDSSEDSVEVKISPISSLKNKRKCAEPRRVQDVFSGPLKKRMCLKIKSEAAELQPFRPWSEAKKKTPSDSDVPNKKKTSTDCGGSEVPKTVTVPSAFVLKPKVLLPGGYFRPPSPPTCPKVHQETAIDQPVALVKRREVATETSVDLSKVKVEVRCDLDEPSCSRSEPLRVPVHPQMDKIGPIEAERLLLGSAEAFPKLQHQSHSTRSESSYSGGGGRKEQRNYKNMTRERRIEANARERTRVHTISAAFDTLRRSIPAYSHNQKLSKLSVLRIACSYIMTLSSLAEDDDGGPPTAECVEMVSRTIQREGKLRKKKDESD